MRGELQAPPSTRPATQRCLSIAAEVFLGALCIQVVAVVFHRHSISGSEGLVWIAGSGAGAVLGGLLVITALVKGKEVRRPLKTSARLWKSLPYAVAFCFAVVGAVALALDYQSLWMLFTAGVANVVALAATLLAYLGLPRE